MEKMQFSDSSCPLACAAEVISDRWATLILRDIYMGLQRFDELIENLGISRNILSNRLASLRATGVVDRRPYQTQPLRHAYFLTPAGLELTPLLVALSEWGVKWTPPRGGAAIAYRHKTCGEPLSIRLVCAHCGQPVDAHTIVCEPGPGAQNARGVPLLARQFAEKRRAAPTD